MRHRLTFLALSLLVSPCLLAQDPTAAGVAPLAYAPEAQASGAMQASNVLNPNVSAIGWFQAEAGHRNPGPGDKTVDGDSFQMKEVELGLQAIVDPWSRADFFISVGREGVDLEEGYLTWYRLPYDLGVKVGKFKTSFGRFNRMHTPETPFADRPLMQQNYLGSEGLNGPGVSVSWQIPNDFMFMDLTAEAITAPRVAENPSFARSSQKDNVFVGRWSTFADISESWNATIGASAALGHAGEEFNPVTSSTSTLSSHLYGTDLTLRWKNIRRSIYHSFSWTTEALWSHRDATAADVVNSHGFFTTMDYQFAQRWHSGVRYDYSQFPDDGGRHESGQLAYVTYSPSEFNLISLQGRQVQRSDGTLEDLMFFKTTFNIGPHGAHPF